MKKTDKDTLRILKHVKATTLQRTVVLNKCIEDKPLINISELHGDNQDILSDENMINNARESSEFAYIDLIRKQHCK